MVRKEAVLNPADRVCSWTAIFHHDGTKVTKTPADPTGPDKDEPTPQAQTGRGTRQRDPGATTIAPRRARQGGPPAGSASRTTACSGMRISQIMDIFDQTVNRWKRQRYPGHSAPNRNKYPPIPRLTGTDYETSTLKPKSEERSKIPQLQSSAASCSDHPWTPAPAPKSRPRTR